MLSIVLLLGGTRHRCRFVLCDLYFVYLDVGSYTPIVISTEGVAEAEKSPRRGSVAKK